MSTTSKISIISATYNAGRYLQDLVNSIRNQGYRNFEYVIIDGGSRDNTIAIIKENLDIISYWQSEPDKGIYDAWNKGLEKVTGEWIMFLGADDVLLPDALENYIQFIAGLSNKDVLDIISSKVQMIDRKGKRIRIKGWGFEWPLFLKEMTIAHPGALHSKNLFIRYGKFDINYKVVGDYELLLRAQNNLKTAFMNKVTVLMREGGTSDSTRAIKEHYKAVTKTGKYPKYKAFIDALIVYVKFRIKKIARILGLNVYFRKAYKI